jgi:dTDP-glucose 4,6-dehydratase
MKINRVLVTGACGFAGSHLVEELIATGAQVVALDNLTYAGRLDRLSHVDHSCLKFVDYDFRLPFSDAFLKSLGPIDYVIHNGAETHVARSLKDPKIFVESNIFGTLNVLEAARRLSLRKFIYVSTDEVFGPSTGQAFKETDLLNPKNPYAATKAAGEHLTYSYFRSFGLPAIITRTMNMFGERQYVEKFVPNTIRKILNRETVSVYVSRTGEMGTRHWLHAQEQAAALNDLLIVGIPGEAYHISSGTVKSNLEIANLIASILKMPSIFKIVSPDGPDHDLHYSIDDSKMRRLWPRNDDFDAQFTKTVLWYKDHPEYLEE